MTVYDVIEPIHLSFNLFPLCDVGQVQFVSSTRACDGLDQATFSRIVQVPLACIPQESTMSFSDHDGARLSRRNLSKLFAPGGERMGEQAEDENVADLVQESLPPTANQDERAGEGGLKVYKIRYQNIEFRIWDGPACSAVYSATHQVSSLPHRPCSSQLTDSTFACVAVLPHGPHDLSGGVQSRRRRELQGNR